MKLSVTIITFNEEHNISRAIKSASFADEIIVIDSHSSDQTAKIAQELGAKVICNSFEGFGQQKNFAAQNAQGPWVFSLDADEEISEELAQSIKSFIEENDQNSMGVINRLTNYAGKWIHHGGWYPDWLPRLYYKDHAQFSEPPVHENLFLKCEGSLKKLNGDLYHYSFPTIASQVNVNVRYAKLGAKALLKKRNNQKPKLFQIIFRPLGKFIECYILKKGFMDGMPGFIIAVNAAHSMFLKYSMASWEHSQFINEEKRD